MPGIYVPGIGSSNPKILFVGEAPSYDDEKTLTPFSGSTGRFLSTVLSDIGISRSECYFTNVSKYFVPPNLKAGRKYTFKVRAEKAGIDVIKSIQQLREEISALNPNVVVPLGGSALWAITGKSSIKSYRGSILQGMSKKVIPTYSPGDILHQAGEVKGYWNKQLLSFDLRRAKIESNNPEIHLPQRTLSVCKSSYQLYEFLQRHKNKTDLSVDIEALHCLPACIGLAFSRHEGLTVPLWNTNGLSDLPDSEMVTLWNMLSEILAKSEIIGQNFGYDRDKIKRLGFIINKLKSDTMLKAFTINPELPKSLAFNTSIYTREPYYKDDGMYHGSTEDLLIGCARDACVTFEVNEAMDPDLDELHLREYYENFILPLHDLYSHIEGNGFRVDEEIREKLLRKYIDWSENINYELFTIAGRAINTGSSKQVSQLLYDEWNLPSRAGTGEEVLTQLLNSGKVKDPKKRRGIELILESRRVKKTESSYLLSLPDYDGRMRTSYFICLETGRSSTQQQEAPIRPTVEYRDIDKKKKKQSRGMAFQTITKHGDVGSDIRTMLAVDLPDEYAPEGYIFLQADGSQAEARVIFMLAEDAQALYDIDHHDYHALTASWFFGGTEDDYSKRVLGYESPIRFAGKTLRHAGHLGASKGRAALTVNTEARKNHINFIISEKNAGVALEIFHKKQPKIKQVFQAGVIKCLEKNRRLSAPVPYGIAAPIGGTRIFYERYGDELFRQAFSYIPQRTISEQTKRAALAIRRVSNEIRILVECHDSLLVMVRKAYREETAALMKKEFERPIDFGTCSLKRGILVVPCEVEEGYNYKDLSKYKQFLEVSNGKSI